MTEYLSPDSAIHSFAEDLTHVSEDDSWVDLNPDTAIHSFGDSDNYTAFMWILDKDANESYLFVQPGSKYHGTGFSDKEWKDAVPLKDKNTSALFGRFGDAKRKFDSHKHPEGGFLTVWGAGVKDSDYPDDEYTKSSNYGFGLNSPDEMKKFIYALLGKFPMKVIGNSPAKLPITPDYMFGTSHKTPQTVGAYLSGGVEPEDAKCASMQINVQNKPTTIAQLMGQLHMVRGSQRDLLKGAFCSQYDQLKKSPETQHCDLQHRQLDNIASNLQCGQNDYATFLKAGKQDYRQRLKDIFRDPHKIGREFRTQKEIDAAWDELNKRENFSFRGWLELYLWKQEVGECGT
jgi:hypothetical protein